METSTPGNLTLEVTFCREFDVQVENASILHLEPAMEGKRTYEKHVLNIKHDVWTQLGTTKEL